MFQTTMQFNIYEHHPSSTLKNLEETIITSRPKYVDIQLWMFNFFIPLCACIIIIVNFFIVVSSGLILHRGQQPRSTYIFLGNVALSDLLMGIVVLFGQYYPKAHRSEMTCCVTMGLTVASTLASFYSVGLIAIDRYLYILYGLQYQRYISSIRARLMILATWLLGFIIGFLPAMGLRRHTDNGKLCWFVILLPREVVFVTASIGIFPLAWIIVLYSIILKHALRKIGELKRAGQQADGIQSGSLRLFRGQTRTSRISVLDDERENCDDISSTNSGPQRRTKRFSKFFKRNKNNSAKIHPVYNPSKWKAIKIVLYTTGSFFVTWFPFYIASVLHALCDPRSTPVYCDNLRIALASPLYILGLTNSILNPIIYAWWHNGFRESVKKLYKNMCCRGGERLESNLSHTPSTRTRISALSNFSSRRDTRTPAVATRPIQTPASAACPTDCYNSPSDNIARGGGGGGGAPTSGSELENSDSEQGAVFLTSWNRILQKKLSEENE